MTRRFALGVIGSDHRAGLLLERLGPGSPSAGGPVFLVPDWSRQCNDPAIDAVFVGGDPHRRAEAVCAALAAGKAVLCPLPAALTHGEWDEIEAAQAATGAPLLTPTDLSCTIAGREALTRVQSGQLGALHAIYCAARSLRPAHPAADVLTQLGWEVLDFVLACTEAQPVRVYAAAGQLFGGGAPDAFLITLRFTDGMIATVEVAQSLPEGFAGPSPEVEIDITGTTGALRVEPYRPAVAVHAGERASSRAWQTPPVAAMVSRLQRALEGDPAEAALLRRNRTLLTVMAAIRQSLAQGNAVAVAR